jgi:hypothetical protein
MGLLCRPIVNLARAMARVFQPQNCQELKALTLTNYC